MRNVLEFCNSKDVSILEPPWLSITTMKLSNQLTCASADDSVDGSSSCAAAHVLPQPNVSNSFASSPASSGRADESPLENSGLPSSAREKLIGLVAEMDPEHRRLYFGQDVDNDTKIQTRRVHELLLSFSMPGPLSDLLERRVSQDLDFSPSGPDGNRSTKEIFDLELKCHIAHCTYKDTLPPEIWHCCHRMCFLMVATDPDQVLVLDAFIKIHKCSKSLSTAIDECTNYIPTRHSGIGGSHMAFVAISREERDVERGGCRAQNVKMH